MFPMGNALIFSRLIILQYFYFLLWLINKSSRSQPHFTLLKSSQPFLPPPSCPPPVCFFLHLFSYGLPTRGYWQPPINGCQWYVKICFKSYAILIYKLGLSRKGQGVIKVQNTWKSIEMSWQGDDDCWRGGKGGSENPLQWLTLYVDIP